MANNTIHLVQRPPNQPVNSNNENPPERPQNHAHFEDGHMFMGGHEGRNAIIMGSIGIPGT